MGEIDGYATTPIAQTSESTLPVLGIFGPNASGKSNFAHSLNLMAGSVRYSHRESGAEDGFHRHPFMLDQESRNSPTSFAVDFVVDGVRHEYGFSANDEMVLEEWLYSFPEGRQRVLFERDQGLNFKFGDTLRGRKKLIADVTRPNSLYLSAAAANNHPQLLPVYRWFSKIRIASRSNVATRVEETVRMTERSKERDLVFALLRYADLGISEFFLDESGEDSTDNPDGSSNEITRPQSGRRPRARIGKMRVVHQVPDFSESLPVSMESSGTRAWIEIIGILISTLRDGRILIMDEVDAQLHPLLSAQLVGLFQNPSINKNGAQLIFNSHDVTLLSRTSAARLRTDEIWFTEKDQSGATTVTPLTEWADGDQFPEIEKGYLIGRFGSIPFLDESLIKKAIDY
ncbi:ATP/GTP-binding protein [Kitasatospora sp. NPDC058965]|uniref:AAA family ATPase n=1 Tax=Kitasatospora sp. NPDC058965 TaxID=3346682 RepID=UPI0036A7BA64